MSDVNRVLPGVSGRARWLHALNKPSLLAETKLLEQELLAEREDHAQQLEGLRAALEAANNAVGSSPEPAAVEAASGALDAQRAELEAKHAEELAQARSEVQAAATALEETRAKLEAEHSARLAEVEAALADARAWQQRLAAEAEAAKAVNTKLEAELAKTRQADDYHGLIPIALYAGGVEWNGTEQRLVRCAPRGELADKWTLHVGSKMYTRSGHGIPSMAYRRVAPALQPKVQHTLPEALERLRKLKG